MLFITANQLAFKTYDDDDQNDPEDKYTTNEESDEAVFLKRAENLRVMFRERFTPLNTDIKTTVLPMYSNANKKPNAKEKPAKQPATSATLQPGFRCPQ